MEARGNADLTIDGGQIGTQQVGQTLHFGPYPALNGYHYASNTKNDAQGYNTDFHLYQMEWTPTGLKFSVDNEIVRTYDGAFWQLGKFDERAPHTNNPWKYSKTSMAPFDEEFYFIINLAVGGTSFFPDNAVNKAGAKPWSNNSPQAATDFWNGRDRWLSTWNLAKDGGKSASLQVDYVRVWALENQAAKSSASSNHRYFYESFLKRD